MRPCPGRPRRRRGVSSRRRTTTPATSGRSAPTSSPGRSSPPIGLGLFPMPFGDSIGWFSPARRAIVPLAGFAPVALAPPGGAALRDPRRHGLRRGHPRLRAARRPGELDRRRDRRAYETPPPASGGRTRSRRTTTRVSREASTASRSAASSRPSRCSHARTDASKAAFVGSSSCLARRAVAGASASSTCSG